MKMSPTAMRLIPAAVGLKVLSGFFKKLSGFMTPPVAANSNPINSLVKIYRKRHTAFVLPQTCVSSFAEAIYLLMAPLKHAQKIVQKLKMRRKSRIWIFLCPRPHPASKMFENPSFDPRTKKAISCIRALLGAHCQAEIIGRGRNEQKT